MRTILGPRTRLAGKVNGESALWVSFDIDDDGYWLAMATDRWTRQAPASWWLIATLAVALSLLGALLISRLVNRPLAALTGAIERLSAGDASTRLSETGPSEIADVNRRFNRMAIDIEALEADRAVALAGISHDIRTPLTRLRMEIEMAPLGDAEKGSMSADIERIDAVVGKFVEYARAGASDSLGGDVEAVDVVALIDAVRAAYRGAIEAGELEVATQVDAGLVWNGDATDLARIVGNLIENALRHGSHPGQSARVTVRCDKTERGLRLIVADRGPGVAVEQMARLMQAVRAARRCARRGRWKWTGAGDRRADRASLRRRVPALSGAVRRPGGHGRTARAWPDNSLSQSIAFGGSIGQLNQRGLRCLHRLPAHPNGVE